MLTENQILEKIGANASAIPGLVPAIHTALTDELIHAAVNGPPGGDCRGVDTKDMGAKLLKIGDLTRKGLAAAAAGTAIAGASSIAGGLASGSVVLAVPVPAEASLGGGIGGGAAVTGGSKIPVLGIAANPLAIAAFGVGIVVTVFGIIWAHHKKQVAIERQFSCAGSGAANEVLRIIEEAVQTGQISPQQGIAALDDLWGQWTKTVIEPAKAQGVFKICDAMCYLNFELAAIIVRKKERYSQMQIELGAARSIFKEAPGTDFLSVLYDIMFEGANAEIIRLQKLFMALNPAAIPREIDRTRTYSVAIVPRSYRESRRRVMELQ